MSKSATSLFVFGIYCIVSGLTFVIIPNVFLGLFNMAATTEQWIRVMGVLLGYLGVYYILAARAELKQFIQWSVYIRTSVILVFGALVITGIGQITLLLFGLIDLLGAIWTAVELRRVARA
jgi:hypothetical protein